MKKYMFTFSAIIIAMMSFVSCSEDLDYRKACEEKDWTKAYGIVEKMLANETSYRVPYQPLKYVVTQEALFVLEEYGEKGLIRIAGIAKEHEADWLYDDLSTTLKTVGDTEMAEKIENMDPHRATLTCVTPVVSGLFKGYYEVNGQQAKIINGKLMVGLKRIKKGCPTHKSDWYIFTATIMNEKGDVVYTSRAGHYGFDNLSVDNDNVVYFDIKKETFEMKSFSIGSEEY